MSYVALGGDGTSRPTFFEMVAAERLMPSLKAALSYSLSVYGRQRPGLQRLLAHEDELFLLISALVDRQALGASSASFAESVYGLRRAPMELAGAGESDLGGAQTASKEAEGGRAPRVLTTAERRASLALLVLVPYLQSKLDALYQRLHEERALRMLGLAPTAPQPAAASLRTSAPSAPEQPGSPVARLLGALRAAAPAALLRGWPWARAALEAARFAHQLAYLLGGSPCFSPELRLLRLQAVRVSGQEAAEAERSRARSRSQQLQGTGSTGTLRALRVAALRAGYVVEDHSRSALILLVFGFKLLEWWYTTGEQRLGGQKPPAPPPPAPAPLPASGGVPLPENALLCALCLRPRTNPAAVATSGYVFCYPCAFRHVQSHGRCPVTLRPAGLDHVRRLYQGT